MPLNIAILASGSGTNAAKIMEMAASGRLDAHVEAVISNRPCAKVLEKAKNFGVSRFALDHRQYPSREAFDSEILTILAETDCQLLVLAGYMRLLSPRFLQIWQDRVVNIHPALLPAFPGIHGAADALEWGVKITGVTVHFVEEAMDSGPPIIQAAVPVLPDDSVESLEDRIHSLEYRIYPQAIQWLAEKRVCRDGRRVWIKPGNRPLSAPISDAFVWPPLEEGF